MDVLVWIGTVVGGAIGLAHAAYLWRVTTKGGAGRGLAFYRGVWAIALWTLFGSYVLMLWIIGAIAYGVSGRRVG
ncbi:MAG: hypothetical protein HKP27_13055 [Myxococcales bacterium]|nr:hypothetical protein [Myxococcales bacterium]